MIKSVICLLASWAIVSFSFGQTIEIQDFRSGDGIEGVNVKNSRSGRIQHSDKMGRVALMGYQHSDTLVLTTINYSEYRVLPDDLKYSNKIRMFPAIISFDAADVVVVHGKEERSTDLPNKIEVIKVSDFRIKNPQTSADVLLSTGTIFVQKSQMGGGSPVIRGFEANKVLLVVDGVRMNNAIYRNGHLQNAITIDNNILKQAEVLFGPSSVMYGSDALGGVVHYRTRDPLFADSVGHQLVSGHLMSRLSSANQEKSFHADVSVGGNRVAMLTSVTRSEFGDLRMGGNRSHGYQDWGLVPYYSVLDEGVDLGLNNPDPEVQRGTGYSQLDFVQKVRFQASENVELRSNLQYSTSSNVPRFDRINDISNNAPKWAEWNYGPQNRLMFALQTLVRDTTLLFDDATITAGVQRIDEDRIQRRFGRSLRTTQEDDVTVYNLNADFEKRLKSKIRFNYGLEITHNTVKSSAYSFEMGSGERGPAATRYPNGGSTMSTFATYLGYRQKLNPKTNLSLGARYSYAQLDAIFIDNEFYDLPFDAIDFGNGALTGSAGIIYKPDSTWQINVVAASGYRSPNVDDFGKVREKDGFALVPNDFLRPEFAYNGELTAIKQLFNQHLQITGTAFYTILKDAIVQRDYLLNGQDSIYVEGEYARVQTNYNSSNAYIYGYFIGIKARIMANLSFVGTYNFTYGQDESDGVPLAHIPPVFGKAGLEYHTKKFRGELSTYFNEAKKLDRYAPGSADNLPEATEDGTPSWWTLNLNTSYYISDVFDCQFAVENILDQHYKVFASGISAPGRNFVIALRASF
jgi:hemoglobin/transferrin/lactoferrin receptor protein